MELINNIIGIVGLRQIITFIISIVLMLVYLIKVATVEDVTSPQFVRTMFILFTINCFVSGVVQGLGSLIMFILLEMRNFGNDANKPAPIIFVIIFTVIVEIVIVISNEVISIPVIASNAAFLPAYFCYLLELGYKVYKEEIDL